jgi:hypothetical protein
MRHRALVVSVLVVALLASAYFASRRGPIQTPLDRAEPGDGARVQTPSVVAETTTEAGIDDPDVERAVSEVRGMSQTFRNSTFLIAIRRAGFYCADVVSASESADGGWLASCSDKGGYTLGVLKIDQFEVRPIAHYFDGVTPIPIERDPPLERER